MSYRQYSGEQGHVEDGLRSLCCRDPPALPKCLIVDPDPSGLPERMQVAHMPSCLRIAFPTEIQPFCRLSGMMLPGDGPPDFGRMRLPKQSCQFL